jgi:tetratricopeptide (TPR) repeat protein
MQRHLEAVVRHHPRDAEAQLRLAAVYLKQFELAQRTAENSMDLSQIRDAAFASAFASKTAQDLWLNVALGENRKLLDLAQEHSRQAVALSPLQGLGYAQLADLSFLESPRAETKDAYIAQAALVRPHNGFVLFIQGREASFVNDLETAFHFWKRAFRQDPEVRHLLVESLADRLPADFFVQQFEPDTRVLGMLFERYKSQQRVEEAKWVGRQYIAGLQRDAEKKPAKQAASCWNLAQDAAMWLGRPDDALRFQQRAVELAPLEFNYRVTLANLLVQEKRFEQAVNELEWCLRRQPDRQDLRAILADARLEHRQGSHSAPVASRPAGPRR